MLNAHSPFLAQLSSAWRAGGPLLRRGSINRLCPYDFDSKTKRRVRPFSAFPRRGPSDLPATIVSRRPAYLSSSVVLPIIETETGSGSARRDARTNPGCRHRPYPPLARRRRAADVGDGKPSLATSVAGPFSKNPRRGAPFILFRSRCRKANRLILSRRRCGPPATVYSNPSLIMEAAGGPLFRR